VGGCTGLYVEYVSGASERTTERLEQVEPGAEEGTGIMTDAANIWLVQLSILRHRTATDPRPGLYATDSEIAVDTGLPHRLVARALASLETLELVRRLGDDRWTLTDEGEESVIEAARHPQLDGGTRRWISDALCGLLDPGRYPGRVAIPGAHEGPYGVHTVDELRVLVRSALLAGAEPVQVCSECGAAERPSNHRSPGQRRCNPCRQQVRK
jgi:hypothetical protein